MFLDSIAYGDNEEDRESKRASLLRYLSWEANLNKDDENVCLQDVLQLWRFSAQSSFSEALFSSITAVLALFLKATSTLVDFRDYGNRLCHALLQEDQLRLIDRSLTINKAKERVISPCLRLLTEIVSFDGGNAARTLFLYKDITFKRLDIFLGVRHDPATASPKAKNKPSLRSNALRYLCANLALQDTSAKAYILGQDRVMRATFQNIDDDLAPTVCEILDIFKKDAVLDAEIPEGAKSQLFTNENLSQIATLYAFQDEESIGANEDRVQDVAHAFLRLVCTTPGLGVLQDPKFETANTRGQPAMANTKLLRFLQSLRPHASVKQSELIVAVFQAAPSLLQDYFPERKFFSFEPKLTATWIGYSMFLFSVLRISTY